MQSTTRSFSVRNGLRQSIIALAAGAAVTVIASSTAHAQTYIGNAYDAGANVGVGLNVLGIVGLTVDGTAGVNYVGALPNNGGNMSNNLLAANANISYLLTTPVLRISGNPQGNAVVGSSSTIGASNVVNSDATISGINLLNGFVTATAVDSHTTAYYSSSTSAAAGGTTTIANLVFGGNSVAITGLANQKVDIFSTVNGVTSLGAELIINEQIFSADKSTLTTNALDLTVYDSTLNTVGLQGKVVVASSTAGFKGVGLAAAPEPGAFALLGSALPCIGAVAGIRRRRAAKA